MPWNRPEQPEEAMPRAGTLVNVGPFTCELLSIEQRKELTEATQRKISPPHPTFFALRLYLINRSYLVLRGGGGGSQSFCGHTGSSPTRLESETYSNMENPGAN